jgi:integrase
MPTAKLTTKRAIDALKHPPKGQLLYWCETLSGFGLLIGVNTKSFILQRDVNGRSRRINLGRYPEISLHRARKRAEQLAGQMRGGSDPVIEERKRTADDMSLREAWELYQQHLTAKERSERTREGYWSDLQRYCSDWLDRPLAEITTHMVHQRHVLISKKAKFAANSVMRTLRAVWNRARRQHRELAEAPTVNVDWNEEKPRTAVITVDDLPKWWLGLQGIQNPIRRDFYIWTLFTGCRRQESSTLTWDQVNFDAGTVHFPKTKTEPFTLPLSDYLVTLLKARHACIATRAVYGEKNTWVFPADSKAGHISEPQVNDKKEAHLFPCKWSCHTLRHTYITIAENKIFMPPTHARLLVNHAIPKGLDAHTGYIHPSIGDLRKSQQMMTDFLLTAVKPKGEADNVVPLRRN